MLEIYTELNKYLNAIFIYLEKGNSFLVENIKKIAIINGSFLQCLEKYSFNNKTVQNNLTFEDVYLLAREIIEQIDKNYLHDFDQLIQSGELDFSYGSSYVGSHCAVKFEENYIKKSININRSFNYNDVIELIHEFIHYTNIHKNSKNWGYFAEFLSIYFELFAIDYLIDKGIRKEEIDYFSRLKSAERHSYIFFQYEIVLLAFEAFGNLDEFTINYLQKYVLGIKKEKFEEKCINLHRNLHKIEERNKEKIKKDPKILGELLSEEFITFNYKYLLGTILAIYAQYYAKFDDIVNLNNHIAEYDHKSVYEICLSIGIDYSEDDFIKKSMKALDEYIKDKQQLQSR